MKSHPFFFIPLLPHQIGTLRCVLLRGCVHDLECSTMHKKVSLNVWACVFDILYLILFAKRNHCLFMGRKRAGSQARISSLLGEFCYRVAANNSNSSCVAFNSASYNCSGVQIPRRSPILLQI